MRYIIISLFFVALFNQVNSQNYLKSKFIDAEYYFLFDEYSKALPLYLSILQKDSNNANINYRIALCYLNLVGQKYKSIPYLEKAVKNVTNTYKEGSYKELKAPFEAYLYLGDAYRINEQIDEASNVYKKFKSLLTPEDVYFNEIANRQIKSCNNAKEMFFTPVFVEEYNLGDIINSTSFEYNPCVSQNEDFMFYSMSKMNEIILFSKKINGEWEKPKNVTNIINTDGLCKTISLSHDGKQLFLTDDGPDGNGDIYVSRVGKSKPGEMTKLNKNINTRFSETHAALSPDGKTLYFTSDRKGGYGGLDIWRSNKESGDWGQAINLGPTINTPYNEETPFITADGKSLYFSSEGHNSIGGFDFFVSTLIKDGFWSVPLNLGYPISTTDDDLFYFPIKNGESAYVSRIKNYGDALSDIFYIKPEVIKLQDSITFKGQITFLDNSNENIAYTKIYFINPITKDTIKSIVADRETNEYYTKLLTSDYNILFTCSNYHQIEEQFIIPNILTRLDVNYNIEFIPIQLASNKLKIISDTLTENILLASNNITKQLIDTTKNINIENIANNTIIENNITQKDSLNEASTLNINKNETVNDSLIKFNINNELNSQKNNTEVVIINNETVNDTLIKFNINNEINSQKNNTEVVIINNEIKSTKVNNELYVIKSIYFDYASSNLNNNSITEVEKLYLLLKANPQLNIELIGNTDSKGNPEYNKILSERRAKSVHNYITKKGINSSRITTKGLGDIANVAINQNSDGSDNPEGRKLNRRVEINILNSGNLNVQVENIYVPDNLKVDNNTTYHVLILSSSKMLSQSEFSKYPNKDFQSPDIYKSNDKYIYVIGNFKNKSNAISVLNNADDLGLNDAKIINSHELKSYTKIENNYTMTSNNISANINENYTVQFKALSKRVDESEFKIENITITECNDGLFRYTAGNFNNYDDARVQKNNLSQLGYEDAFIIKIAKLNEKAGKTSLIEVKQHKQSMSTNNIDSNELHNYTIQIKALNTPIGVDYFIGLDEIKEQYCQDGLIRYTMGKYSNFNVARFDLEKIKELGFTDAFIVDSRTLNPIDKNNFIGKTSVIYTIQVKASASKIDGAEIANLENTMEFIGKDGLYRYSAGKFEDYNSAKKEWEKIITIGYPDAFIVDIASYQNK